MEGSADRSSSAGAAKLEASRKAEDECKAAVAKRLREEAERRAATLPVVVEGEVDSDTVLGALTIPCHFVVSIGPYLTMRKRHGNAPSKSRLR
jgi:hypothetical protein